MNDSFLLDGEDIPFKPGQTVMQAAAAARKVVASLVASAFLR